jgi:hypothetical protein
MSMRFGVSLGNDLWLSDDCWKIFIGEGSSGGDNDALPPSSVGETAVISEELKGAIIRQGITTIVPEVLLLLPYPFMTYCIYLIGILFTCCLYLKVPLCYWSWTELRALVCAEVMSTSTALLRSATVLEILPKASGVLSDVSLTPKIHIEVIY